MFRFDDLVSMCFSYLAVMHFKMSTREVEYDQIHVTTVCLCGKSVKIKSLCLCVSTTCLQVLFWREKRRKNVYRITTFDFHFYWRLVRTWLNKVNCIENMTSLQTDLISCHTLYSRKCDSKIWWSARSWYCII